VGEGILRTPTQVAQLSQTSHFVIAQKQNECDGGVYPFAHQEAVKEHFSLLRVVLQAIQSEVIAGTNECGFHGVDDFAIKQASDEWRDHGNVSQAPQRGSARLEAPNPRSLAIWQSKTCFCLATETEPRPQSVSGARKGVENREPNPAVLLAWPEVPTFNIGES